MRSFRYFFLQSCPSHTCNSHLVHWMDIILQNILSPIHMHQSILSAISSFEKLVNFLRTGIIASGGAGRMEESVIHGRLGYHTPQFRLCGRQGVFLSRTHVDSIIITMKSNSILQQMTYLVYK